MVKLMLLGSILCLTVIAIGAENPLNDIWTNWRARDFKLVRESVNKAKTMELRDDQKREVIVYDVALLVRSGEITGFQASDKVVQLAEQLKLTEPLYIYHAKFNSCHPNFDGLPTYEYVTKVAQDNKDLLYSWVNADFSRLKNINPNVYKSVIDSFVLLNDKPTAYQFAFHVKHMEVINIAKSISNEQLITCADKLLFEYDQITPQQVNTIINTVLDTCYQTQYDQKVKELLTNANNKFYKNIGKNDQWKTACITIQLGLKRFDK